MWPKYLKESRSIYHASFFGEFSLAFWNCDFWKSGDFKKCQYEDMIFEIVEYLNVW